MTEKQLDTVLVTLNSLNHPLSILAGGYTENSFAYWINMVLKGFPNDRKKDIIKAKRISLYPLISPCRILEFQLY